MKSRLFSILSSPLLIVLAAALLLGLGFIILKMPKGLEQGDAYKLIALHVPLAWWGLLGLTSVFLSSTLYLKTKNSRFDLWTKVATESSLLFCILAVLTGSIWAKLVWGVWWTFEPKLTTTFIVCLIYAICIVIRSLHMPEKTKKLYVSILSILGFLDIPFIFMAAKLGTGAHPKLISSELPPGLLFILGYGVVTFGLIWVNITLRRLKRQG